MSEHLYTYDDPPSEKHLAKALYILEHDGVIAYPAVTNWAFACDARSAKALDRIYALNPAHPKDRPFSLLCSSISMASDYANISNQAYRCLKKAWPGPYTVIFESNRSLVRHLKDKRKLVGLRILASPLMNALIERLGSPLATSSIPAKVDGAPYKMGYEVFETYGHALDLVLDLGEELSGLESTVIDFSQGHPEMVREGVGDPSLFC